MSSGRRGTMAILLAVMLAVGFLSVAAVDRGWALTAEPRLQLRGDLRLPDDAGVGVARVRAGWIVGGADALVRLDDALSTVRTVAPAIPPEWRAEGYSRLGDLDVVDRTIYVPFARADDPGAAEGAAGRQAVARYDARTLRFIDAVEVAQHDIAFVAIGPRAQVAYSMDRVDGSELLRYDIAAGWRPLPPLGLGRTIEGVRGADVAGGAVWLSTDDDRHGVYQVDGRTGVVRDLGSAGHFDGTIGGVDVTPVGRARVHVAVTDAAGAALTGFGVVGDEPAPAGEGESGWPPVLMLGAVVLIAAAGGASAVLIYRAWIGLRPRPRRT